jgi:hypothetical protein
MKQVQFGKNTSGYVTYTTLVPRSKREPERKLKDHPVTPPYKYKVRLLHRPHLPLACQLLCSIPIYMTAFLSPRVFPTQMSKRAWDGLIKVWRRQLHFYDATQGGDADDATGAAAAVASIPTAKDAAQSAPKHDATLAAPAAAPAAASAVEPASAPASTTGISWADL